MQCPRCHAENREGRRFCGECGLSFASTCASCGFLNEGSEKFCGGCGRSLAPSPTPAEPRFGSPQSYTPKHLAEKILTSKSALEGERKQVTVLFADLKGSMELLADRDPEEARKLLDPVLEHMMEAVHRYEGTVNQVMGDGIMALFGAPIAHEDHAVRACYAALRMQETVKRYAEGVQRSAGVPPAIRVGLNSGEVIVRSIGSDLHMDYTAVGQTTHLAGRMEQIAMPGSVLMSAETLRLAEGYVHVKSLGPIPVKGLAEPIDVYEATGVGAARTRLQASAISRGLTRFIGRQAEMDLLRLTLERAGSGHGQIVAVLGEPGVGKSRLYWEFIHSHRTRGWLVLDSGSVSYGKATAYLPITDLLKVYFQIEERDDARKVREKVIGKVMSLDRSLEPSYPAILALLDIPPEDPQWERLDPRQRRQRTLDGVKRLLLRESQVQPLLVLVEDLHWIDAETQALLDILVESLPTARLLLLVNYRPEYQHAWGTKTYYRQVRIDPLPPFGADDLLVSLLGTDASLDALKHALIERTEGNPLFLEESVRTLVETKALAGERGAYRLMQEAKAPQVPATVQAILAARIDRLSPDDKRLLQTASAIGKDVPFALLQLTADVSEADLRQTLTRLHAAEFLYEVNLFPDLEYTFKHALTHDVAYGSLLQGQRRALHARIVEAIETLYQGRLGEHVERLAHHAFRADRWEQAVPYLWQAGTKAIDRSAAREAVTWLDHALSALEHLPQTRATLEQGVDLRLALRSALIQLVEYRRTLECLRDAERLAHTLGDDRRRGRVLALMVNSHNVHGQFDDALAAGARALEIAETIGDLGIRVVTTTSLEQTYFLRGDYQRTVDLAQANLSVLVGEAVDVRFKGGIPTEVQDRGWLVRGLAPLGKFAEAMEPAGAAIQIAERLNHPSAMVWAYYSAGRPHLWRGDWDTARQLYERAIDASREGGVAIDLPGLLAASSLALAYLLETEEALKRAQEAERQQELQEGRGWLAGGPSIYLPLCESYLRLERLPDAERIAERVSKIVPRTAALEAQALYLRAEITAHLERKHSDEAESCYQRALTMAAGCDMRPLVAHCHLGLGKLYRSIGEHEQAREHLTNATTLYREMDMTYWLEQAATELTTPTQERKDG